MLSGSRILRGRTPTTRALVALGSRPAPMCALWWGKRAGSGRDWGDQPPRSHRVEASDLCLPVAEQLPPFARLQ